MTDLTRRQRDALDSHLTTEPEPASLAVLPTCLVRLDQEEQLALRHAAELVRALAPDAPEWLEDAEALEAILDRMDSALGVALGRRPR